MANSSRLIKVPAKAYVYAWIDPADMQKSALNILTKLGKFFSYTELYPYEEIPFADAPQAVQDFFGSEDPEQKGYNVIETEEADSEDEPMMLSFPNLDNTTPDNRICLLNSATYVMIDTPAEDIDGTWKAVKQELGGKRAASLADSTVEILPPSASSDDLRLWLIFGACDRVVMPLWPEEQIDNKDMLFAWKQVPHRDEEQAAPRKGAHVRVVAVWPEEVRGMQCRMWYNRRDETPGIGTINGRFPVDVAVSVPSPDRVVHIHSFHDIKIPDWRPGLVFYGKTGEDGCPLDMFGTRLEQYKTENKVVNDKVWRSWLKEKKSK